MKNTVPLLQRQTRNQSPSITTRSAGTSRATRSTTVIHIVRRHKTNTMPRNEKHWQYVYMCRKQRTKPTMVVEKHTHTAQPAQPNKGFPYKYK